MEITEQPKSQHTRFGRSVTFRCKAQGFPNPQHQWYKDSVIIPDGIGEELYIAHVEMSDSGTYECIVSNRINALKSNKVELQVLPAPGEILQMYNL